MKKFLLAALAFAAVLSPSLASAGYYVPTCGYITNLIWNGFAWVPVTQYVCG
jgi:hypothetical protein